MSKIKKINLSVLAPLREILPSTQYVRIKNGITRIENHI